jgi:hypothetical protein
MDPYGDLGNAAVSGTATFTMAVGGGAADTAFFSIDSGPPIAAADAGPDTNPIYSGFEDWTASVDTTVLDEGEHSIVASATQGPSQTDSDPDSFQVDNHPVVLVAPTSVNGGPQFDFDRVAFVSGKTVSLAATTGGATPDSLTFFIVKGLGDFVVVPSRYDSNTNEWKASLDATKLSAGVHLIVADAVYGSVHDASTDRVFLVVISGLMGHDEGQLPPPDMNITSPTADEAVTGTLTMSSTVSPAPVSAKYIVLAELGTYDHEFTASSTKKGTWDASIDTTKLIDGPYLVKLEVDAGVRGGALTPATHIQVRNHPEVKP